MEQSNENRAEKRKDTRLGLVLPLEFSLRDRDNAYFVPRCGQTRNVSSGGVYFETEGEYEIKLGSTLAMRIAVPSCLEGDGSPMTLQGEGKVLRIDSRSSPKRFPDEPRRRGIAVEFSRKPTVRLFSLMEYIAEDL